MVLEELSRFSYSHIHVDTIVSPIQSEVNEDTSNRLFVECVGSVRV
jgi:hypothetical protein